MNPRTRARRAYSRVAESFDDIEAGFAADASYTDSRESHLKAKIITASFIALLGCSTLSNQVRPARGHYPQQTMIADYLPIGSREFWKEAVRALQSDGTGFIASGTDTVGYSVRVDARRARHAQRLLKKLPHAFQAHFPRFKNSQ